MPFHYDPILDTKPEPLVHHVGWTEAIVLEASDTDLSETEAKAKIGAGFRSPPAPIPRPSGTGASTAVPTVSFRPTTAAGSAAGRVSSASLPSSRTAPSSRSRASASTQEADAVHRLRREGGASARPRARMSKGILEGGGIGMAGRRASERRSWLDGGVYDVDLTAAIEELPPASKNR